MHSPKKLSRSVSFADESVQDAAGVSDDPFTCAAVSDVVQTSTLLAEPSNSAEQLRTKVKQSCYIWLDQRAGRPRHSRCCCCHSRPELLTEFALQAFENTSTSVAASQMRNALNALADTVKDPQEKHVSTAP